MMTTTTVAAMQQQQGGRLHVDESDMFGSACLGVGLSLALAAGLGDLEVSLEDGCELVGEGAGVPPGFPPLSDFLPSLGLSLDLLEPPSFCWFLDLPSPFCRTTLLLFSLFFGCMESQWLLDLQMEHCTDFVHPF